MLIKEYRIPLPLTVEEYRIAQLYMIAVSTVRRPLYSVDFPQAQSPTQPGRTKPAGPGPGPTGQDPQNGILQQSIPPHSLRYQQTERTLLSGHRGAR